MKNEDNSSQTSTVISTKDHYIVKDNILEILTAIKQNNKEVILSTDSTSYSFLTRIKSVAGNRIVLLNSIPPSLIKSALESTESYLSMQGTSLRGEKLSGDGKHLFFTVLSDSSHTETRGEERLSFDPDENVNVEFLNPLDKKTTFKRKVLDISPSGFSFESYFDSKLFDKGQIIENIDIKFGDKKMKHFSAKVMYKKRLFDTLHRQRYQIGLKIEQEK